jgi:hypothetical protein
MTMKLNNDDSCAVDLMFERNEGSPTGVVSCFGASPQSIQDRLEALTKVLSPLETLQSLPLPSHDLVARTLARCAQDRAAKEALQPRDKVAEPAQPTAR